MKKRLVCLILTLGILALTGCNSQQKKEIELFNQETDGTLQLYDKTVAQFEGHEDEFVKQLIDGNISSDWAGVDFRYSEWTSLIHDNVNELIADDILVKSSNFYTALGMNSVTQILIFGYRGTDYLAEILWVDAKIDMMNLEVLNS